MSADDLRSTTWVTFRNGHIDSLRVRRCRLEVTGGPDRGVSRDVIGPRIRVGAHTAAELVLTDRKVSGLHAEIVLDRHGYRLRDLESTNGTFVGGARIIDAYVAPGATIEVGHSTIRLQPLRDSVGVPLSGAERMGEMVGRSAAMRGLFAQIERVAASDATVLVCGETGVGKELVAGAIHDHSGRNSGPLVIVNCGAIPAGLFESELFGHEKGAFTDAHRAVPGAFERAHGGTLFLDEIGELSPEHQPKLLRAIEHRQIRRVGGERERQCDARIVAATNRDLAVEVNRGAFRSDLFYRLDIVRLDVPPLRERREDIRVLVEHFAQLSGVQEPLSDAVIASFERRSWPGNVRQLRNAVERGLLLPETLADDAGEQPETRDSLAPPWPALDTTLPFKIAKRRVVDEFERRYLTELLERHHGNVSAAARSAAIDRMTIYKLLQRLDLKR